MMENRFNGVFAAAVTPMKKEFSPDLKAIPAFLEFLDHRGCHGALLLGTTGEGPSFSFDERNSILKAACEYKNSHPEFLLMAGTGTPSLTETINLTAEAFSMGCDAVVVLPPYYFRKVNDQGLFAWFTEVLRNAVPTGGALFGYHIPQVTGIPISFELLEKLMKAFPGKFAGIKDSSGDPGFARSLGERFGNDLQVLNGNDRLFSLALDSQAAGCITALANLYSPVLRTIWDGFQQGVPSTSIQTRLDSYRVILEKYAPYPPVLKAMLARQFGFPAWTARPPLEPVDDATSGQVFFEFSQVAQD